MSPPHPKPDLCIPGWQPISALASRPPATPCAARGGAASATASSRPPHRRSAARSEEHTSELQSLMRISYAVFCLKKKNNLINHNHISHTLTYHHLAHHNP